MNHPRGTPAVWEAMADQFLDTENRSRIPKTALLCVETGLSAASARRVWRYEVTPAVWLNSWSVAGEWAGWNTDWLVSRIEEKRRCWPNRAGLLGGMIYRVRAQPVHPYWVAIERCMEVLQAAPAAERTKLADDLTWLAHHFFDSSPRTDFRTPRDELRQLYLSVFLPIFKPLVVRLGDESLEACERRVAVALSEAARPAIRT